MHVPLRRSVDGNGRIRDTGEGIEPESLSVVFQMFQQQEQGTGRMQGWASASRVKQLTEAHRGTVSVA